MNRSLKHAALISFGLATIKGVTFIISGSQIVLSSMIDSTADMIVSLINGKLFSLSRTDADREHPFGHGGFEVIGSLIQGVVIALFGMYICTQSIESLISPSTNSIEKPAFAFTILIFAACSGYFLQLYLTKAEEDLESRNERALSISSDKAHYLSDFYFNLLSASGVLIVWITNIAILDAIFAFFAGLFMIKAAYPILYKSYHDIAHSEVELETQNKLVKAILSSDKIIEGVHRLRARNYGPLIYVDFHLKLPSAITLEQAHEVDMTVKRKLKKVFPKIDVTIHLDPDSEPDDDLWEPRHETPHS